MEYQEIGNRWLRDSDNVRELEQRLGVLRDMVTETEKQLADARDKLSHYDRFWLEAELAFYP